MTRAAAERIVEACDLPGPTYRHAALQLHGEEVARAYLALLDELTDLRANLAEAERERDELKAQGGPISEERCTLDELLEVLAKWKAVASGKTCVSFQNLCYGASSLWHQTHQANFLKVDRKPEELSRWVLQYAGFVQDSFPEQVLGILADLLETRNRLGGEREVEKHRAETAEARVRELEAKLKSTEGCLTSYKLLYDVAISAADRVFQVDSTKPPPLLPGFLQLGDCKFEGVVKLAEAYKELQAKLAAATEEIETLKTINAAERRDRESEMRERDEALAKLSAVRGELKWAIEQNGWHISASGLLALLDVKE